MTSAILTAKTIPSALPEELPVFPITGSVLMPHARLPLNVFEPRYLAMVEDVLGKGRMIGMIQPMMTENARKPALYSVGCVGRITSFNETEDGRFLIVLAGVCRFRVVEERYTTRLYRTVKPDWAPYLSDMAESDPPPLDRERLIELMQLYFKKNAISVDWKMIKNAPDKILLPTIIMICPLAPNEKQALLEAESFTARAEMLMMLLEMAVMPQVENEAEIRH